MRKISLEPIDIERIAILCGSNNENIKHLEERLNVDIHHRGHVFKIDGEDPQAERAEQIILKLYDETPKGSLSSEDIHINLQESSLEELTRRQTPVAGTGRDRSLPDTQEDLLGDMELVTPQQTIIPKGANQKKYLNALNSNDIQFVVGPAGTGKTFLAVAYAVQILKQKRVERICLIRPAVEAGEHLGFLPGTLIEKINPYLQPLYDSLYSTLGVDATEDLIKTNVIEVSALAYMRGRTLNNCIAILDEGQNASREQMKMFLTRIGFNSKAVITGDLTQIDLPQPAASGMIEAIDLLQEIDGIGVSRLNSKDVVRHPLVTKIINAYDKLSN